MANRDVHALSSNAFAVKPADTPEGAQGALSNQVIERTLCVQISGSLANLALAGPQAAMWKPVTGKEPDIFCPSMSADMDPTGEWLCGAFCPVLMLAFVSFVLMHFSRRGRQHHPERCHSERLDPRAQLHLPVRPRGHHQLHPRV